MHIVAVPILLYILPFVLLFASLKLVNRLIKRGKATRPIALVFSLALGGAWVFAGFELFNVTGMIITSFIVMLTGGVLVIVGGFRSLFVSKRKIIDDEVQEKIAEEHRKIEEKNYESYDWLYQESRKILDSGKIDDYIKFSRLKDVLDNNRKYPELKQLYKELRALEDREQEERFKRIGTRGGY